MSCVNSRILVISNDAFNQSSSNGRTLMNLLKNIPSQNLAQFYIHGNPQKDFCSAYYCNSDNDALRTFLFKPKLKKAEPKAESTTEAKTENRSPDASSGGAARVQIERNCRNLLVRDIVWTSYRWWQSDFDEFLDKFSPEVVLLQAGDSPFMYDLAMKIAKRYRAKIVIFNTEYYVLKKYMYSSVTSFSVWHSLLKSRLCRRYARIMRKVDFCIYNIDALEDAYQQKYPHPNKSCTLYTTSEMEKIPNRDDGSFNLLYCGNLGVGRCVPLDEIARALREVDENAKLDIYGKFKFDEDRELVCANPNVVYHGYVDYSEIPSIMASSSVLIHCENDSRVVNLKYAMSTKIADSLASGRPFLVYASRQYPFVQYLERNSCAHVASDYGELCEVLSKCIRDVDYRYKYTDNAIKIASENHDLEKNCIKVEKIINRITSEKK